MIINCFAKKKVNIYGFLSHRGEIATQHEIKKFGEKA